MSIRKRTLPRLLYLGDVPVEMSYHGSTLLFRLLQGWPPEYLRLIEGNFLPSLPERRLQGIEYREFRVGNRRLLHTRFASLYSAWLMRIGGRIGQVTRLTTGFRPEAVLTVTHGFLWLAAARFAAQHELPLHLICHDDLPRTALIPGWFRAFLELELGRVYRQAVSRLCVSPFMCEAYRERFGANGTVLYPSRAADCPRFDMPPERIARNDHTFTIAYCGTINSQGYVRALTNLAVALAPLGGRLLIFGPLTPEAARQSGLERSNIVLRGLVKSNELMTRLREEADTLFVPMSFSPTEAPNMRIAFPSKLTDYTAVGLPLLIYGPEYCSAVRWARENPGVAEVVIEDSLELLRISSRRLAQDAAYRLQLGIRAMEVGQNYFSYQTAQNILYDAICGQPSAYTGLRSQVPVESTL